MGDWTTTMGQQGCGGNGQPATCRMLASAAPPIQGNNQLMWTVWGGGDKRGEQFGGIEPQERVKVESIDWRSLHLHSNKFQIIFLPIPEQKKHWKQFCMHLGSKAALSAPW